MTNQAREHDGEDVGNIVMLEHVNLTMPDQGKSTLFYVAGLGFTRDPYMTVSVGNMWINVGQQQFHLPTRSAQVIPGHIGIVMPSLDALAERLTAVEPLLAETKFAWSRQDDYIAATCPWGNQFRCYAPSERFGSMVLGVPYVEFAVAPGSAEGIASFYQQVFETPSSVEQNGKWPTARIMTGRDQCLLFRETADSIPAYDGHHIAVYVANFSAPYAFMKEHELLSEDVRNHQFRFQDIVDMSTGRRLFQLEHEVRSMSHPMYRRPLINRNPMQNQQHYVAGQDAFFGM